MMRSTYIILFVLFGFFALCYGQVTRQPCPTLQQLCAEYPDRDYFVITIVSGAGGPPNSQSYWRYRDYYEYYLNGAGEYRPLPFGFRVLLIQNRTQPGGTQLFDVGVQYATAGAAGCVETINIDDSEGDVLGLPSNITSNEFRLRNQNSTFMPNTLEVGTRLANGGLLDYFFTESRTNISERAPYPNATLINSNFGRTLFGELNAAGRRPVDYYKFTTGFTNFTAIEGSCQELFPSVTSTPSLSTSLSSTSTASLSASVSLSSTPSLSTTSTASVTASISVSPSITPSAGASSTSSASISLSPSVTPSPSISLSASTSLSSTPSNSPITPSSSASNSISTTSTPSRSNAPSFSRRRSPSVKLSRSSNPSRSAAPSPSKPRRRCPEIGKGFLDHFYGATFNLATTPIFSLSRDDRIPDRASGILPAQYWRNGDSSHVSFSWEISTGKTFLNYTAGRFVRAGSILFDYRSDSVVGHKVVVYCASILTVRVDLKNVVINGVGGRICDLGIRFGNLNNPLGVRGVFEGDLTPVKDGRVTVEADLEFVWFGGSIPTGIAQCGFQIERVDA